MPSLVWAAEQGIRKGPGEVSGQGQIELDSKSLPEQDPNSNLGLRSTQALDPALTQAVNGNKTSESQRESGLQRVQGSHWTPRLQYPRETPLGSLGEGEVVRLRAALGVCRSVSPRA